MTDRVDELLHEVERPRLGDPRRSSAAASRASRRCRPGRATDRWLDRRARLLEGGPIADEIRTAVAEDVATFTARATAVRRAWPSSSSAATPRRPSTSSRSCAAAPRSASTPSSSSSRARRPRPRSSATIREPQRRPGGRRRHRPDAAPADDPPARGHRRHRPGQGHRRHPSAQRRPAPPRATTASCRRPRTRRSRSCAAPGSRSRARTRSSSAARAVVGHAGRVPARQGGRDGHGLPLADARPRRPRRRAPTSSSSPPASPGLVTGAMLKPGAVVVDVGINVVDGQHRRATSTSSRRVEVASAITPGPGRRRPAHQRPPAHPPDPGRRTPSAAPTAPLADRLDPRRPMSFPSDLEIARSVTPRPIVDIARELGIARRRARAVRPDQGQGHARGDHAARGRATARQVRRRHRDHPDAARRGQVDDDRRPRPGPQPHRPRRPRSTSASRRSGRSSGSRAARPAAATARSSRWRTSTST